MAKPSFNIDDEVEEWVSSRLIAGQSKSVWYRYAVKSIMQCDPVIDEIFERYQYDERQEFIEEAVKREVERRKNEVNGGN